MEAVQEIIELERQIHEVVEVLLKPSVKEPNDYDANLTSLVGLVSKYTKLLIKTA